MKWERAWIQAVAGRIDREAWSTRIGPSSIRRRI
jgi:hypothetical protein